MALRTRDTQKKVANSCEQLDSVSTCLRLKYILFWSQKLGSGRKNETGRI